MGRARGATSKGETAHARTVTDYRQIKGLIDGCRVSRSFTDDAAGCESSPDAPPLSGYGDVGPAGGAPCTPTTTKPGRVRMMRQN